MPLAVLLAGLTGSGKTTVAQALADRGYLRLSVDEEVHRLHGRYGVDYPEHTYFERERPVVEATRDRFIKEIEAGNDVVLDHGLWRRAERDAWRQAAREAGGLPVLVYLPADRDELLRRLAERNEREDANVMNSSGVSSLPLSQRTGSVGCRGGASRGVPQVSHEQTRFCPAVI
ncbi:ATP-binding protein [Streptomyces sp. WAC04770]|nr:ATP-binding protein [Streptomyces sp. WAC04770]RST25310.1 ATP-binding protein [Streptomyces sp. WAC04770]